MKSPKAPPKSVPTTTNLRAKDPMVLRAEIAHFRQKITDKASEAPQKAALILSEWVNKPAPAKKSAA